MGETEAQAEPKLRWYQFHLWHLLVVILVFGLVCGIARSIWLQKEAHRRARQTASLCAESQQLAIAIETYRSEMGGGAYPPSDPAEAERHFRRAFPRYTGEMKASFSGPDEALHFWLAGPNGEGWSADPVRPFADSKTVAARRGPFYDFDEERLQGHVYKPFEGSRDSYVYIRPNAEGGYEGISSGACSPFLDVNLGSFQIHCPGPDGKFGTGGTLQDSTGYTEERWDDVGNFDRLQRRPESEGTEQSLVVGFTALLSIVVLLAIAMLIRDVSNHLRGTY